jgi:hypothetical protein
MSADTRRPQRPMTDIVRSESGLSHTWYGDNTQGRSGGPHSIRLGAKERQTSGYEADESAVLHLCTRRNR